VIFIAPTINQSDAKPTFWRNKMIKKDRNYRVMGLGRLDGWEKKKIAYRGAKIISFYNLENNMSVIIDHP